MPKARRILCLAIVAAALLAATASPQNPPPYYAITGARIVPVSGPPIENGTVVVANGLIAAVGADVSIPPEAWVIDGQGMTVYPGLIDALTDLGLQAAPQRGARPGAGPGQQQQQQQQAEQSEGPEDRPATTPWENAADDLKADDRRLETWRNAGFTTALAAPQRGIFAGNGAVINLAGERPGDMVVKSPATFHIAFRSPGGFFGFPGSLMGTLAYIKQVYLDAGHYAQAQAIYDANPKGLERPRYDRAEQAVHEARAAGWPVLLPANTTVEIHRAIRTAGQIGLENYILYGGQQGYEAAEALAAAKAAVLVNLKWPEKDRDADPEADEPLRTLRFRDRAPSAPAALEKAGVKFAFYNGGITAPKDLLKNAKKAIDAGLAADAALRAFTLSAAEILGVADRLGSLEPGKIANLVVADGDIFEEKTKVKYVFVDGRMFEAREPARPTEPPTVNLTGRWSLTINSPQGSQTGTAELTQTGGTLTGTVTTQLGSSTIADGWVSGNRFSFTVSFTMGAGTMDATFSGTVEEGRMKGTVGMGAIAVDFTGTRPAAGSMEEEGE